MVTRSVSGTRWWEGFPARPPTRTHAQPGPGTQPRAVAWAARCGARCCARCAPACPTWRVCGSGQKRCRSPAYVRFFLPSAPRLASAARALGVRGGGRCPVQAIRQAPPHARARKPHGLACRNHRCGWLVDRPFGLAHRPFPPPPEHLAGPSRAARRPASNSSSDSTCPSAPASRAFVARSQLSLRKRGHWPAGCHASLRCA